VALHAALDHLANLPLNERGSRLLVIDDLATFGWSAAAPRALGALFAEAQARGIAIWCGASSLAAAPRPLLDTVRELTPTTILATTSDDAFRLTARALRLTATAHEAYQTRQSGEALLVRGEVSTPLRTVPLRLPPYTLRR
jgi:hypothetical protein